MCGTLTLLRRPRSLLSRGVLTIPDTFIHLHPSRGPRKYSEHHRPKPHYRISEYLRIATIKGKGLGVVATKDIEACTLIFAEPPAACSFDYNLALQSILSKFFRTRGLSRFKFVLINKAHDFASFLTKRNILRSCQLMTPETRARFHSLHAAEDPRLPNMTKECLIWRTNARQWSSPETEVSTSHGLARLCMKVRSWWSKKNAAVLLGLSRFNHSCLPNTESDVNQENGKLEVYSTRSIRIGQEVTISYIGDVDHFTVAERKDALRNWNFECKCAACATSNFTTKSDRRRKALSLNQSLLEGLSNSKGPPKPSVLDRQALLFRHGLKLHFDEGFRGLTFWVEGHVTALTNISAIFRKMQPQNSPTDAEKIQLRRWARLLQASMALARRVRPRNHVLTLAMQKKTSQTLKMLGIREEKDLNVRECEKIINEFVKEEPDFKLVRDQNGKRRIALAHL